MTITKLSIIIPCYNCALTLEESVSSCYAQNLTIPFEVILVDDGSTDSTREVMAALAAKHDNIVLGFHKENLGGGAARNTAVSLSEGEVIFCLDSDDMLPSNTLPGMLATLEKKGADGAVFEGGLSFSKNPTQAKKYSFNIDPSRKIELSDFFAGKTVGVTANFLYTRKAFDAAGGYPIRHNFDTQGFGLRFLSRGLTAHVSPGAYFLQRQFAEHFSYFERSYNAGEFSSGHFLMFQEALHHLRPKIREMLFAFDIFNRNRLDNKNIQAMLTDCYAQNPEGFFIEGYRNYLSPDGARRYVTDTQSESDPFELPVRAYTSLESGKPDEALGAYFRFIEQCPPECSLNASYLATYVVATAKGTDKRLKSADVLISNLSIKKVTDDSKRPSLLLRIWRKGLRLLKDRRSV